MAAKSPKRPGAQGSSAAQSTPENPVYPAFIAWLRKYSLAVFLLLTAVGSARIVATYEVFNDTFDEAAHVACGMEWLAKGEYRYETQHPPLARVATALGPYLVHVRPSVAPDKDKYVEGGRILCAGGHYDRNLALARLGILPFFWVACLVTYLWARRCRGEPVAALAVLLFTFLPPVLAHAGLATTDMALAAFTGASFLAALYWLDRPDWRRSVLFGAATGLAVLSKFTALAFIPVAMAAALAWYFAAERPGIGPALAAARRRLLPFLLAVAVGFVVIWAGYRFSFGALPLATLRLPAPELWDGIREALDHNRAGHPAYLLGATRDYGWWYYYPVVLAVKTPLPFLALLLFGAVDFFRRRRDSGIRAAIAFSGAILFFCLFSRINIGVRHILPVYIGFSIVAAAGASRLLELWRGAWWARWTLGLLLCWMAATSALSHPDYLPYFNALAGDEPEKILVDSDLDWGQDLKRLEKRLQELGARQLSFTTFRVAYPDAAHGFPPTAKIDLLRPSPGWSAVGLTLLRIARVGLNMERPDVKLWPDLVKPTERVGKGIYLWYLPPSGVVSR